MSYQNMQQVNAFKNLLIADILIWPRLAEEKAAAVTIQERKIVRLNMIYYESRLSEIMSYRI